MSDISKSYLLNGKNDIVGVVADGVPNLDVDLKVPDAEALSVAGVAVYAVGITNAIDENLPKSLSSQPQVQILLTASGFVAIDYLTRYGASLFQIPAFCFSDAQPELLRCC